MLFVLIFYNLSFQSDFKIYIITSNSVLEGNMTFMKEHG